MRYVRHIPMLLLWLLSASLSYASDQPPVAVITYSPEHPAFQVYDGERVLFDGLGSYDPDGGAITDYEWYVNGTGEADHTSTFTWTFDIASGTSQSVKLRVKDNEGGWSETTLTFTVLQRVRRYYYVKDHLGSVRATVDESGDLVGYDDYYPFGLRMAGRSLDYGESAREKYTGHELDGESGLLYAGARYYDPVIGRWQAVDPLADDYPGWSPYNYVLYNPLMIVDPDGKAACDITLCGENGSSITVETDLIDDEFDVSGLGIDFGGNHSIGGDEVVLAALDVVGIVDPSGVADGIAASIYASKGEIGNTLISAVSLVPYVGDVAKAGRIGKSVSKITSALGGASTSSDDLVSVYRVFGGDSPAAGFSWTPVNPNQVSNFRDVAGLPSGGASGHFNTGRFVIEGMVRSSDIIKQRDAYSLDGNVGGLLEYIIDPNNVSIRRVSGVNPEF